MNQRRQREQRDEYASAGTRAERSGFDRPSLKVPDGVQMWRPEAKAYTVTFLPFKVTKSHLKYREAFRFAEPGQRYYERTYFQHGFVGYNQESVVCPARTMDGDARCPVCEERQRMEQDPKYSKEEKSKLWPSKRQLFLVFVKEEQDKGVQLWEVAEFNFGTQLDLKIKMSADDVKAAREKFFRPDVAGFDLRVVGVSTSHGEGRKPFNKFSVDDFLPRKKPVNAALLNHGVNLDDIPVCLEYKELAKKFHGEAVEVEDEDVEEDDDALVEDDDGEESDDDNEESDDDTADYTPKKGDMVSFSYRKEVFEGKIVKIDKENEIAHIKEPDREKPYIINFDDINGLAEVAEDDDEDDDVPPPKRGRKAAPPVEEDEDDGEEEDAEEENDEEPTRWRGRGKADAAVHEEEEEDEVEDDDEPLEDEDEDDKPPPKRRGVKSRK